MNSATISRISLFFLTILFCQIAFSQSDKYGALAIDRSKGYYYGFSYDQETLANAEKTALYECQNRGGDCEVVLRWSGNGCGVYRTVDEKDGTAYGWGLSTTKEEADRIAIQECLKRSNGVVPMKFAWACNSLSTKALNEIEEIYSNSASSEIEEKINFNGYLTKSFGFCEGSVASATSDDESTLLVINNFKGSSAINGDFYTNGCMDCAAIQYQNINSGEIYIAVDGAVSQNGNTVSVDVWVVELMSLATGDGQRFHLTATIDCTAY